MKQVPDKLSVKPAARRRPRSAPADFAVMGRHAGLRGEEYLDALRSLPGEDGAIYRMVFGANEEEWVKMAERELAEEIAVNRHKFVTKFGPRRRKR